MVECIFEGSCDVSGSGRNDIELLRQQVIVHLLRLVPMGSDSLCAWVRQLLHCGVLTKEVMPELGVSGIGVGDIPGSLQPTGAGALVPLAPAWPRMAAPGLLGHAPSRFEHEFECVELLGRGAFGEVWRCRHRLDGREYAVKSVRYHSGEADRIEQRVLREAQTWASMDHPNVARYHSAWVEVARPAPMAAGRAPGAAGLALPAPAQAPQALRGPRAAIEGPQAETATSIAFTVDNSDDGVTFRDASEHPSDKEPRRPSAVEEPGSPGVVARRGAAGPGAARTGSPDSSHRAVLYIQTELCSKDTLGSWIAKRNAAWPKGLPGERRRWALEACRIFRECTAAVAHLHARRCVHRDLKPTNVLFAGDGTIRLGDFGLAKVVDGSMALEDSPQSLLRSLALQQETRGVGTPAYASPEQLAGGVCGVKADVYALGVMLVELLNPVATQMERAALLQGLRSGRWAAPAGGSFHQTARLVAAMTRAEPAERPSAEEVLRALPDVLLEVQQHFDGSALVGAAAPEQAEHAGRVRNM